MVNAWRAGAATLEERYVPQSIDPSPYVRVLRTRRPADSYPILKQIMDEVGGRFEDASDHEIHESLRLLYLDDHYRELYRRTGILCGLEPATALAGICKGVRKGYIARGERVLLNVSGAAKTGDVQLSWLEGLL
jgi:threonine synthase